MISPNKTTPVTKKVVAAASAVWLTIGFTPQISSAKRLYTSALPPTAAEVVDPRTPEISEDQKVLHLLNRLTFGPRPGDVEDVKKIGIEKFIQMQLNPGSIPEPDTLTQFIRNNEAINQTPIQLFREYGKPIVKLAFGKESEEDKKAARKIIGENYRKLYGETSEARLRRAVESPRQLEEVMTDFWFNHFNVSNDKGLCHLWVGSYEETAIRPYALGKFQDLVEATSHHPAMLFYLDNWQNTKATTGGNGPILANTDQPQQRQLRGRARFGQGAGKGKANGAGKKASGLNENYARELMELHTLGVDGGYTQQDVIQLAKILTGLGLPPKRQGDYVEAGSGQGDLYRSGAYFDPNKHDFSNKVLLGVQIKGTGEGEIEQAIALLCHQRATAHHISYQLAQYFVADDPPPALVDRLTVRFQQTDGDIKAMLNDIFHSPEFWDQRYENAKFKNPYRYVLSSLRASNVALNDYKPVIQFCNQLGMPLYKCLTPDGYKNTEEAWLSPDSLLQRIQFATGLGAGKLPDNPLEPLSDTDVKEALNGQFSQQTLQVVAQSPKTLKSALLLGSPEFMKY